MGRGAGNAPEAVPPLGDFPPPEIWSENNRKISITKEICITIDSLEKKFWKKASLQRSLQGLSAIRVEGLIPGLLPSHMKWVKTLFTDADSFVMNNSHSIMYLSLEVVHAMQVLFETSWVGSKRSNNDELLPCEWTNFTNEMEY